MPVPYLEIKQFKGLCNTVDRARIPLPYLEVCENVDIDDEGMIHCAPVPERKIFSGNVGSLWVSRDKDTCLFVEGGALKRLYEDDSVEILLPDINEDKLNFDEFGDKIIFSGTRVVGFIEAGKPYPFPHPTDPFKRRMVGGHLIAVYNSRLYAAQNNKIFFSDATIPFQMDMRKNFLQFDGWITMMKPVEDGLYIGAGNCVYYLAGDDPLNPGFLWSRVTDSRVIEGTAITIEGVETAQKTLKSAVLWVAEDGIYMGFPQGIVAEVTKGMFAPEHPDNRGAGAYHNGITHGKYIFTYEIKEGYEGGDINIEIPALNANFKGG